MSLLANQTAINPESDFFAASAQGAYVASVTAGSNVELTGTATNPIINVVGFGTSADNSSRYGAKTIADSGAVTANNFATIFTIANTYFPLSNTSYLLKVNYVITSATISNATGGLGVQVNYAGRNVTNQFIHLNSQSTWTNSSNVPNEASMCGTFIPDSGSDPLSFVLVNSTTANLTTSAISFDISITSLTTSNVSANNWP